MGKNQSDLTIGVIIPARNEEASIALVLQDIPGEINTHVVVVDNASSDATARIAAEFKVPVLHQAIPGYGRAMSTGIDYFKDKAVDVIVFLDGDYSDYPQEMINLVQPIVDSGFDLIVSTRLDPLYDRKSLPFHVAWGNRLVVFLMNLLFHTEYTDLGPFRAIRYESLMQLQMEDQDYGWTVEMQVKAKLAGLNVTERRVKYRRRLGQSKISGTVAGSLQAGLKMLYTLVRLKLSATGRINSKKGKLASIDPGIVRK